MNNNNLNYLKYATNWVLLILLASLQVVLSSYNLKFAILILSSVAAFSVISTYFVNKYYNTVTKIFAGFIVAELIFLFLM
jgi:hypothetical protein